MVYLFYYKEQLFFYYVLKLLNVSRPTVGAKQGMTKSLASFHLNWPELERNRFPISTASSPRSLAEAGAVQKH